MPSTHTPGQRKARQKPLKLPTGAALTRSIEKIKGRAAHIRWERTRGDENESDAEKRIRARGSYSKAWWDGWLERSDEWRQDDAE